jgi:hypothetical protein
LAGIFKAVQLHFVVGIARASLKQNAVAAGNLVSANVIIVTRLLIGSRRDERKTGK